MDKSKHTDAVAAGSPSQPFVGTPGSGSPLPELKSAPTCRARIIVIDDDADFCIEMADWITSAGHEAFWQDDSSQEKLLRQYPMDIAMVDLNMPGVDGIALLNQVYGNTQHKPALILVSGMGEDVLRSASLYASQSGFPVLGALQKPFTSEALTRYLSGSPAGLADGVAGPGWRELPIVFGRLKDALDSGLPSIEFQPKISIRDCAFLGCEALLATVMPGLGNVPAPLQIEAMRVMGRLSEFTWLMTEQAIRASAQWQDCHAPRPVAVNWPIEVITEDHCVSRLLQMVTQAHLTPACVTIELSEHDTHGTSPKALENLTRLRIQGFGISLDDYGQENSNLYQLSILPLTEAKIDRELIAQMPEWPRTTTLIEETVTMFRRMGIGVVAEGVETLNQATLLRRSGCDGIQGHLIARKMPPGECLDWVRAWETMRSRPTTM